MNLIITCARHFEDETREEIKTILESLGDVELEIVTTEFSGILTVRTSVSYSDVIKKIRQMLEDEPWSIRYTLRVIPVFNTVKTNVQDITKAALRETNKIAPEQTYRITIEKRDSDVSSSEIISQIANNMKNKVSLKKYDWIILIEILGKITGVAVVKDNEILSTNIIKRKLLD